MRMMEALLLLSDLAAVQVLAYCSENYHISFWSCCFSFENRCAIINGVFESAKENNNEPEES